MFEFFDYFRKNEINKPRANQIVFQSVESDFECELFKFDDSSVKDIIQKGDLDEDICET